MSIFGQIISADELEDAVQQTLSSWWRTYAREFELQQGLAEDILPEPKAYLVAEAVEREAADQLPAIVIVSPGLTAPPKQEGDGTYRATFGLAVGIFVTANTRRATEKLVRQYAAIIRAIMLQKQALGGIADGTNWMDESYDDDFNFTDQQTISAGQVIFEIEVTNVVNRFGGPAEPTAPNPDTQPGSDWPVAQAVSATVKPKE